jgi:hypothetical protein
MRYLFGFVCACALGVMPLVGCSNSESSSGTIEWAASAAVKSEEQPNELFGFGIAISNSANSDIQWLTDGQLDDYKPAYSPDASKIAFFRVFDYGDGPVRSWKTKLCVMNADGSDYRELTSGDYADWHPYWTRDGSDQITFTRFGQPLSQGVYRTSPDADPGDERLISDPQFFEYGYSSLSDGRILLRREFPLKYFLVTPDVGGAPVYEEISYPVENAYLHKMTISPSETKIAYMKVENITQADIVASKIYFPAIIAYADFDADGLRIENEVEITEYDDSTVDWYPSWDPNEEHLVYAHSGVIRGYSLETGITEQISSHDELDYRYPTIVGQTK